MEPHMRHITALSLFVYMTAIGCTREPAESPKAAWVELMAGFQAGDVQRVARVVSAKDEDVRAGFLALVGVLGEMIHLGDAATKKWGTKAKGLTDMREALAKQFAAKDAPSGEANIDGDRATLMMTSGKTLAFVRVRGGWKVDFDSLGILGTPEEAKAVAAGLGQVRGCFQARAAAVESDPTATLEQAQSGFVECMQKFQALGSTSGG